MKLNFDENIDSFSVSAYAEGWIRIGDRRMDTPFVVSTRGVMLDLLPPFAAELGVDHFTRIGELGPEIVLLGTGAKQIFVDYAITEALAAKGIALETMDTGAACRSYNILLAEDRAVVAAFYMI